LVSRAGINDDERSAEAAWIVSQLHSLNRAQTRSAWSVAVKEDPSDKEALIRSVKTVLKYFQDEYFEVPYIWHHRRDNLTADMTNADLWKVNDSFYWSIDYEFFT
jgi:hypothetical protein